jgi:hypothetical protein
MAQRERREEDAADVVTGAQDPDEVATLCATAYGE